MRGVQTPCVCVFCVCLCAAVALTLCVPLPSSDTSSTHGLFEAALRADAIDVLINILEVENLKHLVDASSAKVAAAVWR